MYIIYSSNNKKKKKKIKKLLTLIRISIKIKSIYFFNVNNYQN